MTVYNQHIFTAITVGPTGHQHEREAGLDENAPTAITCDECAPYLMADGWTADPSLVPKTDRQIADEDKREKQGNAAVRQAAEVLAETIGKQAAANEKAAAKQAAAKPRGKPGPKPKAEKAAKAAEPSTPVVVLESEDGEADPSDGA